MNKIGIIIQREYFSRVKKKSFLVLTIITPLLFVGLIFAPALLMNVGLEQRSYIVVDDAGIYGQAFTNTEKEVFQYKDNVDSAKKVLEKHGVDGVIHIASATEEALPNKVMFYYVKSEPSLSVSQGIESKLRKVLQEKTLESMHGLNKEDYEKIRSINVSVETTDLVTGEKTSSAAKTILAYVFGFMNYFFVFLFGAQVMAGVSEEKTNRVIEVMISSVKPFSLMMGKIVGIALVGLTQFLIWILLSFLLVVLGSVLLGDFMNMSDMSAMMGTMPQTGIELTASDQIMQMFASLRLSSLLFWFVCFFVGGYMLYAAFFAAIGAAVDSQEDAQKFTLPITVPLLLAIIFSTQVLNEPNGPLAFWLSIIPFTSPVIMMIRLPFGVEVWEIALSLGLLIGGFIFATYISARIYKIGVLMYGKKVDYKELWKWLKYK